MSIDIPGLDIKPATPGENAFVRYVISAFSMGAKTYLPHQLILAYGIDEVLIGNCGRALDAILPFKPHLVDTSTPAAMMTTIDKLYQESEKGKKLPMWMVVDDFSAIGRRLEKEHEKKRWPGKDEKEQKINQYKSLRIDLTRVIDGLSLLPINVIINITLKIKEIKEVKFIVPILPGAAFLAEFPTMTNNWFVLRTETKKDSETGVEDVTRWFQTVEGEGYFAGCRTGSLEPSEPANLPLIHEKITGVKPTFPITVSPDGTAIRKESK